MILTGASAVWTKLICPFSELYWCFFAPNWLFKLIRPTFVADYTTILIIDQSSKSFFKQKCQADQASQIMIIIIFSGSSFMIVNWRSVCLPDKRRQFNMFVWAIGACDDIFHFFLSFYWTNDSSINGVNYSDGFTFFTLFHDQFCLLPVYITCIFAVC